MNRGVGKLLLLLGVLAFGIFYGISLSSSGIEEIYGPIGGAWGEEIAAVSDNKSEGSVEAIEPKSERIPELEIKPVQPVSNSLLSKLLDKIGSLLNVLADHLIRLIVKLGEAVLS